MQEPAKHADDPYLSRSELELHLARLALVVMRASPDAFESLGIAPRADPLDEPPAEVAAYLLRCARPEHRPFVEARLVELSRSMAGTRGTTGHHDWLSASLRAPAMPAPPAIGPASRA